MPLTKQALPLPDYAGIITLVKHGSVKWSGEGLDVRDEVAKAASVSVHDLETSPEKRFVRYRRVGFQALRELDYSYEEIGSLTGGYAHSCVIYGVSKLSKQDKQVAKAIANKLKKAANGKS